MEAIALTVTGILSTAVILMAAAYWQFVVEFLVSMGVPQHAAAVGPIPTVMLITLMVHLARPQRA